MPEREMEQRPRVDPRACGFFVALRHGLALSRLIDARSKDLREEFPTQFLRSFLAEAARFRYHSPQHSIELIAVLAANHRGLPVWAQAHSRMGCEYGRKVVVQRQCVLLPQCLRSGTMRDKDTSQFSLTSGALNCRVDAGESV